MPLYLNTTIVSKVSLSQQETFAMATDAAETAIPLTRDTGKKENPSIEIISDGDDTNAESNTEKTESIKDTTNAQVDSDNRALIDDHDKDDVVDETDRSFEISKAVTAIPNDDEASSEKESENEENNETGIGDNVDGDAETNESEHEAREGDGDGNTVHENYAGAFISANRQRAFQSDTLVAVLIPPQTECAINNGQCLVNSKHVAEVEVCVRNDDNDAAVHEGTVDDLSSTNNETYPAPPVQYNFPAPSTGYPVQATPPVVYPVQSTQGPLCQETMATHTYVDPPTYYQHHTLAQQAATYQTEASVNQTVVQTYPTEISDAYRPESSNSVKSEPSDLGAAEPGATGTMWNYYGPQRQNVPVSEYSTFGQYAEYHKQFDMSQSYPGQGQSRSQHDPMLPSETDADEMAAFAAQQAFASGSRGGGGEEFSNLKRDCSHVDEGPVQSGSTTAVAMATLAKRKYKKVRVPPDPMKWQINNVKDWLGWCVAEYSLHDVVDVTKFPDINGREVCQMPRDEFVKLLGNYDAALQLLEHLDFLREAYIANTDSSSQEGAPSGLHPQTYMHNSGGTCAAKNDAGFGKCWPSPHSPTSGYGSTPPVPGLGKSGFESPHAAWRGTQDAYQILGPISARFSSSGSGQIQLWQFLLELLSDSRNSQIITWEGTNGEFKLSDPDEVARKWGERKSKPNMNYDKLSRALRYYYDKNIMTKVHGKRYAYKFDFAGLAQAVQPSVDHTAYKYQQDMLMSAAYPPPKLNLMPPMHAPMTSSTPPSIFGTGNPYPWPATSAGFYPPNVPSHMAHGHLSSHMPSYY